MAHRSLTEHFLLKSGLFLLLKGWLWVKYIATHVLCVRLVPFAVASLLVVGAGRGGVWASCTRLSFDQIVWTNCLVLGLRPSHFLLAGCVRSICSSQEFWLLVRWIRPRRVTCSSRLLDEVLGKLWAAKLVLSFLSNEQFWILKFGFESGGRLLVMVQLLGRVIQIYQVFVVLIFLA